MATSRESRMQQRLRGAQRHQVEDQSFGALFPTDEEEPPLPRTTPNTSARRRRLDGDDAPSQLQAAPAVLPQVPSSSQRTIYDFPDRSEGSEGPSPATRKPRRATAAPKSSSASRSRRSVVSTQPADEEVGESPADAPGSGQRRTVEIGAAANQSTILQQLTAIDNDEDPLQDGAGPIHPPSTLRSRMKRGDAAASAKSTTRSTAMTGVRHSLAAEDDADELSPFPSLVLQRPMPSSSPVPETTKRRRPGKPPASAARSARPSGLSTADDDVDELSPAPATAKRRGPGRPAGSAARSARRSGLSTTVTRDDVDELSPPLPSAQHDVDELSPDVVAVDVTETVQLSSPLARWQQKSGTKKTATEKSPPAPMPVRRRRTRASGEELEVDELSPEQSRRTRPGKERNGTVEDPEADELSPEQTKKARPGAGRTLPLASKKRKRAVAAKVAEAPEEVEEEGEAEEIDEVEATQRIGRKRPRRSLPEHSPEPSTTADVVAPTAKRRRKPAKASPAKQSQPKPQKRKAAKEKPQKSKKDDSGGKSIAIMAQRFSKIRHRDDDPDADILNQDNPYAWHQGVNAVDVLSQMCEEVINLSLDALREEGSNSSNAAARKEIRTKLQALDSFKGELQSRLLQHTVALDAVQALKKRVRAAQREKLSLREELLRIRAEREQVALRMDAVRIKHEAESKEALHHISLSTAMHDIDLAVEQGQAAPELTPAEQKKAELANLELLISRVADEACTGSNGGGVLQQIKGFNAFLERAAAALEKR